MITNINEINPGDKVEWMHCICNNVHVYKVGEVLAIVDWFTVSIETDDSKVFVVNIKEITRSF